MKILIQFRLKAGVAVKSVPRELFVQEELFAWSRYRSEHCREFYLTQHAGHIAVVAEYEDAATAARDMSGLPLMKAGVVDVEFLELHPFINWELLFADDVKAALSTKL